MSSRFGFDENVPPGQVPGPDIGGSSGGWPGGDGTAVQGIPERYLEFETRKRLSLTPILVAGVALVLSTLLMFVGRAWPLPVVGWILTPFVVVGCLVWGRALVVRHSGNPMFDREDARSRLLVLQVLTFIAFVASLPHVWRIGQEVALWLQ